jgi:hypothetical protein
VEKRNRVPSPINRPLKFPTEVEQSTKPPFTNVHELAHAVQPIVSAVPFVIVQGHSKVKTYGVNNLDTPVEKQTLGSKAVVKEKEHEKDAVAYKGESEEAETAFTTEPDDKEESGEWQDQGQQQAAVERPIAAGRPRPSHNQGVANGRPIDIRFPSGQGVKRPPLRPLLRPGGGPSRAPQLRPMRPVFFTKRTPSGIPTTHSNPFEYFSQLARLTASRIKAPVSKPPEPITPRTG